MTSDDADAAETTFEALMAEVMTNAARFGHRQHVQLTWLAVRSCGTMRATSLLD
jgi:hypothetical protein